MFAGVPELSGSNETRVNLQDITCIELPFEPLSVKCELKCAIESPLNQIPLTKPTRTYSTVQYSNCNFDNN